MEINKKDVFCYRRLIHYLCVCLCILWWLYISLDFGHFNDKQTASNKLTTSLSLEVSNDKKTDKKTQRLILVTLFRGGSSFLGELFNKNPDVIYWFEPLRKLYYKLQKIYHQYGEGSSYIYEKEHNTYQNMPQPYTKQLVGQLENILSCNLSSRPEDVLTDPFITWAEKTRMFITSGPCVYSKENVTQSCVNYIESACHQHSYMVVKSIRLAVYMLEPLLSRHPDLKIIHYVRDPRGTINSRYTYDKEQKYVKPRNYTLDAAYLCHTMIDDWRHVQALPKSAQGRIMSLKYEQLAMYPLESARKIYSFVGLELTSHLKTWLDRSTKTNRKGLYSTSRLSNHTARRWKTELPQTLRSEVERVCQDALKLYHYTI